MSSLLRILTLPNAVFPRWLNVHIVTKTKLVGHKVHIGLNMLPAKRFFKKLVVASRHLMLYLTIIPYIKCALENNYGKKPPPPYQVKDLAKSMITCREM